MRYLIEHDEWWPVHDIRELKNQEHYDAVEIPDELVVRYRAARAEFIRVQNEIAALHGCEAPL